MVTENEEAFNHGERQKVPKNAQNQPCKKTGFFGGALVFWAQNVIAFWADFLGVFFDREEGCCVVRFHTEGNDVSRALRKHSKN